MSISAGEIVALWKERRQSRSVIIERMRQVRDHYNADIAIALPELDENEKAAVANLVQLGLDQTAMRISSLMPDVRYPAVRPGIKSSEQRAMDRRRANLGWWQASKVDLLMDRRARHYVGYACAPVAVVPDFQRGIPCWQLRDPLSAYPGAATNPDDPAVGDCVFSSSRSWAWLERYYPEQSARLRRRFDTGPDDVFVVLDYMDAEWMAMIVVGRGEDGHFVPDVDVVGRSGWEVLEVAENKAGQCLAVVPGRVTLDRVQGQLDGVLGMYQAQAKLLALETIAVQKGVFPDDYLVARPNETPQIVQIADGRRGVVGIVKGGDFRQLPLNPGYQTMPTINYYERAQRISGGIPAEYGGESATNVRTGRRGDAILSATVDHTIAAGHKMFAASLEHENRVAVAVAKGWFGKQPKSFYVEWGKVKGRVEYTPESTFETDDNVVSYASPGADRGSLTVEVGQLLGTGVMSTQTAREMHPLIDDPEQEHDRMVVEALERAALAGMQQQAQAGSLPFEDLVYILEQVKLDKADLVEAVNKAQRRAQERQAVVVPPGTVEAEPGLSVAGMGSEATAAVPGPPADLSRLSELLGSLRGSAA